MMCVPVAEKNMEEGITQQAPSVQSKQARIPSDGSQSGKSILPLFMNTFQASFLGKSTRRRIEGEPQVVE
jgi:hypothetical protein